MPCARAAVGPQRTEQENDRSVWLMYGYHLGLAVRLPSTNEQRLNVDSRSQQLYVPGAVQLYAVDAVSVTAESCSLKPGACR